MTIASYAYLFIISLFALVSTYFGLSRYRHAEAAVPEGYSPNTLVIVPCRGEDLTLDENLRSISGQRYKPFRMVAVVDSESDSALASIRKCRIGYIVTDKKFRRGSGKVNAISTALSMFRDYDAYVIADSDITAKQDWLSLLIEPLGDKTVGLSTTFPYFKPMRGFWSRVKMSWGLVGQGMMESDALMFGWGGSLAFRRDLLDKKSFEFFSASLSDDIAITTIVKRKRLKLFYVKEAMPTVNTKESFGTFFEWANRQTALSIRGNRNVFWLGILSYSLNILLLFTAIILSAFYSYLALLYFVPILLGVAKAYGRLESRCDDFLLIHIAMPFIFLANLIIAKNMSRITWRGKDYEL